MFINKVNIPKLSTPDYHYRLVMYGFMLSVSKQWIKLQSMNIENEKWDFYIQFPSFLNTFTTCFSCSRWSWIVNFNCIYEYYLHKDNEN